MRLKNLFMRKATAEPPPTPTVVSLRESPPAEYIKLARDAGFEAMAKAVGIQEDACGFRQFLADNGLPVYSHAAVRAYLKRICPLFRKPVWVEIATGTVRDIDFRWELRTYGWREYDSPIPDVVLRTVIKIRTAYPSATFWVSDFRRAEAYAPAGGDPFLGVQISDEFFIIERWDEPAFRQ